MCGATAQDDLLEVDHIKQVCDSGLDTVDNLRVLCQSCNFGSYQASK